MSDLAIRASHLRKAYSITTRQGLLTQTSVRDDLTSLPGWLRDRLSPGNRTERKVFWALDDVSFDIAEGETVGIVGKNGAGKSTLIKILSRITRPSSGYAELYGRVSTLLEVGAGFHPDLTGRENVFLGGAVLGMQKRDIASLLDEIVAFAEVGEFLDMPVKRYSSGMYLRLAFAVAVHLESEIMLVDEALAVGDIEFQQKCLAKMQQLASKGRTVLFVSHSMQAVSRLCSRAIMFSHGKIVVDGPVDEVVNDYLQPTVKTSGPTRAWPASNEAPGDEAVRLRAVRVCDEHNSTIPFSDIRQPVGIEMSFDVLQPGLRLQPDFRVFNSEGVCVFVVFDSDPEWLGRARPAGRYTSTMRIPGNFLAEGRLTVGATISSWQPFVLHCHESEVVSFEVIDKFVGDVARGVHSGPVPGVVRPVLPWTTQFTPASDPLEVLGR